MSIVEIEIDGLGTHYKDSVIRSQSIIFPTTFREVHRYNQALPLESLPSDLFGIMILRYLIMAKQR